jgi:hypothetical protein
MAASKSAPMGAKKQARADFDWYKEPRWANRMLFDHLTFGPPDNLDLICDPCAGSGWILDEAAKRGHPTVGMDLVNRNPRHQLLLGNATRMPAPPIPRGRSLSVVCNPPFGYEKDIAERIIRNVITWPIRRAAFIVPIGFMCGQERWRLFAREYKPSHLLVYSRRPSMPPGHAIDQMATPFEGGMADFIVMVWTGPSHRWRTETIFMDPGTI